MPQEKSAGRVLLFNMRYKTTFVSCHAKSWTSCYRVWVCMSTYLGYLTYGCERLSNRVCNPTKPHVCHSLYSFRPPSAYSLALERDTVFSTHDSLPFHLHCDHFGLSCDLHSFFCNRAQCCAKIWKRRAGGLGALVHNTICKGGFALLI